MKTFTLFENNTTAQLQLKLIRSALALADYRMERSDQGKGYLIWHQRMRKSQSRCRLGYCGWGDGIARWWTISGEAVPVKVIDILEACAIGGES